MAKLLRRGLQLLRRIVIHLAVCRAAELLVW